jgi:hypothetical protein
MANGTRDPIDVPRNFTITTQERLRAIASGPPPFALRLRRIEDLTAAILGAIAEHEAAEGPLPDTAALPGRIRRDIEQLNVLIDNHNRYYPIEARLPIDLHTRQLMDWGQPWVPRPPVTAEALIAASRRVSV